jgi:hypothetical protein
MCTTNNTRAQYIYIYIHCKQYTHLYTMEKLLKFQLYYMYMFQSPSKHCIGIYRNVTLSVLVCTFCHQACFFNVSYSGMLFQCVIFRSLANYNSLKFREHWNTDVTLTNIIKKLKVEECGNQTISKFWRQYAHTEVLVNSLFIFYLRSVSCVLVTLNLVISCFHRNTTFSKLPFLIY